MNQPGFSIITTIAGERAIVTKCGRLLQKPISDSRRRLLQKPIAFWRRLPHCIA
jgi:hypothetical protein